MVLNHAVARAVAIAGETSDVDPNMVSPGVIGFAITFLVGVAIILIILDLNRRVRRVRHRAEARERLLAEREAAAGGEPAATAPEG